MIEPNEIYRCKDPQTGPHNRCRHPVAPPAGYKRCGTVGCAVVIPEKAVIPYCVMCQREAELLMSLELETYQHMMVRR